MPDIELLDHCSEDVATTIYDVFQSSYKVEAELLSNILRSLLDRFDWQTVDVETAVMNQPAISLYKKFGFSESKRWTTNEGIDKVQLTQVLS